MRFLMVCFIASRAIGLDAPEVTIVATGSFFSTGATLTWSAIDGAHRYLVYGKSTPYTQYALLVTTTDTAATILIPTGWSFDTPNRPYFFEVKAEQFVGPEMTFVPSGTFMMGQAGVAEPVHQVTLTSDFYISTGEVTNAEYLEALRWAYENDLVEASPNSLTAHGQALLFFGHADIEVDFADGEFALRESQSSYAQSAYPSGYDPSDHPVILVSWYGATCYCDWRSMMEGLEPYYNGNWQQYDEHNPYTAVGYRLPTEAEWEYAARYPDNRLYPWGNQPADCSRANYGPAFPVDFCVGWTAPRGSAPLGASDLGLLDMGGNVYEWVGDHHSPYTATPKVNPLGGSGEPILRSSSWDDPEFVLSSARRSGASANYMGQGHGFRICRTAQ